MKYPITVKALAERICQSYPAAQNQLEKSDPAEFKKGIFKPHFLPAYLLWMLQELETFDDREKAARWLGWVMGKLDGIPALSIVTLQENRDFIRADKEAQEESGLEPDHMHQSSDRFTDQFRQDYPPMNMDDNSWAKMDEEDSM